MGVLSIVNYKTAYHDYAIALNGKVIKSHLFASKARAQKFIDEANEKGFTLIKGDFRSALVSKTDKVNAMTGKQKDTMAYYISGGHSHDSKWKEILLKPEDYSMLWTVK